MVWILDVGKIIKSTTDKILDIKPLLMIFYTDSKLLYNCPVKLYNTQKKWLMVNIMCLRQSYERCKIMEIRWIDGYSNPANTMTKAKLCAATVKTD